MEIIYQGLAEYAIIFKEIKFGILARRPQTFYTNKMLPSLVSATDLTLVIHRALDVKLPLKPI